MAPYLIDIRTNLHPEEIDAYVAHVQAQIKKLEAYAAKPGRTVEQVGTRFARERERAAGSLTSASLGSGELNALSVALTRAFAPLRDILSRVGGQQIPASIRAPKPLAAGGGFDDPEGLTNAQKAARNVAGALQRAEIATLEFAEIERLLAAEGRSYAAEIGHAKALTAATNAEIRLHTQAGLARSPTYVADTAAGNHLAAVIKLRVSVEEQRLQLAAAGIKIEKETNDLEIAAQANTLQRVEAGRLRAAEASLFLKGTGPETAATTRFDESLAQARTKIAYNQRIIANLNGEADEIARSRVLEAEANAVLAKKVALLDGQNKQIQETSFFQRFRGRITGQPAENQQRLGQFLGSSFSRTAGFALSAGVTYGAIAGVRELVKNAEELERTFTLIRAQFNDEAGFKKFKAGIFDIARATGESSKDVAFLAYQLRGVFSDDTVNGAEKALTAAKTAAQAVRITGLSLTEVTDSLTAASQSFGVSFAKVTDLALAMQNRTGVLAKESIKAVADLAPVAAEVGLSAKETFALVTTAQKFSGQAGSAIAEGLGRILPAMEQSSIAVVQLYSQLPQLSKGLGEVADAVGRGDYGDVLLQLIRDYEHLTGAQQANVISLLGGRREAQVLIPILKNSKTALDLMGDSLDENGTTARTFAELQESLAQKTAKLAEAFRKMGQSLFEAGLGDILKDLAAGANVLVSGLGAVLSVLAQVNQLTGGWGARVLLLTLGVRGLAAALLQVTKLRAVSAVTAGVGSVLGAGASGITGPFGNVRYEARGARLIADANGAGRIGQSAAALRGGGGALVAGLGGTPAIAGIAVTALALAYADQRSKSQAASKALAEKIKKLDIEELRRRAKQRAGFWDDADAAFFGTDTDERIYRDELANRDPFRSKKTAILRRTNAGLKVGAYGGPGDREFAPVRTKAAFDALSQDQSQALGKALLEKGDGSILGKNYQPSEGIVQRGEGLTEAKVKELRKIAEGKGEGALAALKVLDSLSDLTGSKYQGDIAKEITKLKGKTLRADVRGGDVVKGVDQVKAEFEAGEASAGEVIRAYEAALKAYKEVGKKNPLTGHLAAEQAKLQRDANKFIANQARQAVDTATEIRNLSSGEDPSAEIAALTALISGPGAVKDPDVLRQAAIDIAANQRRILDGMIKGATDDETAAAIAAKGIKYTDQQRTILTAALLRTNPIWSDFISRVVKTANITGDFFYLMAKGFNEAGIEGGRKVLEALVEKRKKTADETTGKAHEKALRAYRAAQKALDEYNKDFPEGTDATVPTAPEGVTGYSGETAEETAKRQREELRRKQEAEEQARFDIRRARAEGDSVALAQIDIEAAAAADRNARHANDKAAILQAEAARITAERNMSKAVQSLVDSHFDLLTALAEEAGDSVEVARLGLEAAEKRAAANSDPDARDSLQADIVRRRTDYNNAQINAIEEQIDTDLALHRITTGQAVAKLRAAQLLATNQKEIDRLQIQINQLLEQSGQDLRFNLPQLFAIPTLYEARRANISGSQGVGYQDNRQQQVIIYNNGTPEQRAESMRQFEAAMNAPPRNGSSPRSY